MQRPSLKSGGLLAAAALTMALGGAPLLVTGADHLDAPALGTLTQGGVFNPLSTHGERDINDVYVFEGSNSSRTVLAMTTNPAVNAPTVQPMPYFGSNVRYVINIDRNGNNLVDFAYVFRFGEPDSEGAQDYTVTRYTGFNATSLKTGVQIGWGSTDGTGIGTAKDGAKVFAGVRSDPFFFDLTGFIGTVFGVGDDDLEILDGNSSDFFEGLNTNAIVVEVPDDALGSPNIGVWGSTSYWNGSSWVKADQMGRPAINTVFNTFIVDGDSASAKNSFNTTPPSSQRTAQGSRFRDNIIQTLTAINGYLGTTAFGCTDYDATTAGVIADILLPDLLTYDVTQDASFSALNGRALADDVIDFELGLTTNGCVMTDGANAGPHTDYLGAFPYLGAPH